MPRLTNHTYQQAHHRLKRYWRHAQPVFGRLTPTDQWQLHDYFQPTKSLTESQLVEHRAEIAVRRPALPAQAGQALRKIDDAAAAWALTHARRATTPVTITRRRTHQPSQVVVYGIVQPEVRAEDLLAVLLDIASDELTPAPRGVIEDLENKISYPDAS
jgi:Mg-chelatase subunit ChlI